jgi:quercetin dioxygenase-like cupin family protein
MKTNKIIASIIATVVLVGFAIPGTALAQVGNNRVELQRHDLSAAGREVVQVVVTIGVGQSAAKHKHPGEEIIYVLQGTLEYYIEGKNSVTVKAGLVLFIPAETFHSVRNIGGEDGKELATYVVEKGKPLITLAK